MTEPSTPAASVSRSTGEVRLSSGRRELVAIGTVVTVGEDVFHLPAVDRIAYHVASRGNHTSFRIRLRQAATTCDFMVDAYRRGTELNDTRAAWGSLVELVERWACPNIARTAIDAIRAGGTVAFGGAPAARIDGNAAGLRPRRLFAKTVPWSRIARADFGDGLVRVWTTDDVGAGSTVAMSVDMSGWNAVVLPRVVRALAAR